MLISYQLSRSALPIYFKFKVPVGPKVDREHVTTSHSLQFSHFSTVSFHCPPIKGMLHLSRRFRFNKSEDSDILDKGDLQFTPERRNVKIPFLWYLQTDHCTDHRNVKKIKKKKRCLTKKDVLIIVFSRIP